MGSCMDDQFLHCPSCEGTFSLTSKKPRRLECQHTFCEQCIDGWLQQLKRAGHKKGKIVCPYCSLVTKMGKSTSAYLPLDDMVAELLFVSENQRRKSEPVISKRTAAFTVRKMPSPDKVITQPFATVSHATGFNFESRGREMGCEESGHVKRPAPSVPAGVLRIKLSPNGISGPSQPLFAIHETDMKHSNSEPNLDHLTDPRIKRGIRTAVDTGCNNDNQTTTFIDLGDGKISSTSQKIVSLRANTTSSTTKPLLLLKSSSNASGIVLAKSDASCNNHVDDTFNSRPSAQPTYPFSGVQSQSCSSSYNEQVFPFGDVRGCNGSVQPRPSSKAAEAEMELIRQMERANVSQNDNRLYPAAPPRYEDIMNDSVQPVQTRPSTNLPQSQFNMAHSTVSRLLRGFGKFSRIDTQPCSFREPANIALSAAGKIVVTDAATTVIQVFSSDGNCLSMFKVNGARGSCFVNENKLAVATAGGALVCDMNGTTISKLLTSPVFSAVSYQNGIIFVQPKVLSLFGKDLSFRKNLSGVFNAADRRQFTAFSNITDVSCGDMSNGFVVLDTGRGMIHVMDDDGVARLSINPGVLECGKLRSPCGIAMDANGKVFVSDQGNSRVLMFGSDGQFLRTLLSSSDLQTDAATPLSPYGITVINNNQLLVIVRGSEYAQIRTYQI